MTKYISDNNIYIKLLVLVLKWGYCLIKRNNKNIGEENGKDYRSNCRL